jgi:hypothetical protein
LHPGQINAIGVQPFLQPGVDVGHVTQRPGDDRSRVSNGQGEERKFDRRPRTADRQVHDVGL